MWTCSDVLVTRHFTRIFLHLYLCILLIYYFTALFQGELTNDGQSIVQELKTLRKIIQHFPIHQQLQTTLQLGFLQWKQRKAVELLLDVHGHQILQNGVFNGDWYVHDLILRMNVYAKL